MNLFLAVAFICAFLSTPAKQISAVRLEVRAVRVIYVAKLRVIHDARNTDDTCHVTDVAAVEGAAKFLDRVTGLHVSRDIHWEYVPLDAAELQRAETAWQQWMTANGTNVRLEDAVAAAEATATQREVP